MRKLTIELILKEDFTEALNFFMEKIESMTLIELLKIDFEKGFKLAFVSYKLKEGYDIDDLTFPDHVDFLSVVKKQGDEYICLVKANFLQKFMGLVEKLKIDLIWTIPTIFTTEKMIISVIGDEINLKKYLETMKLVGEIKNISFKKAIITDHTLLSCLTLKQKEIIIAAKKNGYYKYPRKINSEQLSNKVGLSKPTVIQHLRKAEVRLMSNILAGY